MHSVGLEIVSISVPLQTMALLSPVGIERWVAAESVPMDC